jgi:hypothetical protein
MEFSERLPSKATADLVASHVHSARSLMKSTQASAGATGLGASQPPDAPGCGTTDSGEPGDGLSGFGASLEVNK